MMTLLRNVLLALVAISTSSTALCLPRADKASPPLPLDDISNAGSSPLPAPSKDPKAIVLGLGFQNYTCSAATSTWVQSTVQAGAIADLYDISDFVTSSTGDRYTVAAVRAFETCLRMSKCTPSPSNGYCSVCHTMSAAAFVPKRAGAHYFDQINGAQMPNFNLWGLNAFLSAKKAGSAKAPADAYKGANGLGTVDWLYLVDNNAGRTEGMSSVYRVETAGGVAPASCPKPGSGLQVPYAAEYWFYD